MQPNLDLPMHEWVTALPLHPCTECALLEGAGTFCTYYQATLPEPSRPCRCVRFEQRAPALPWDMGEA
jgi:hypothetical protein